MTTYQSRMMNIARQGAGRVDVFDDSFNNGHRIGHRDARHAAADIAVEADAEIARLQAQVAESQQQSDALLVHGLEYCDKIEALQAQVAALAGVMTRAYRLLGAINHDWPGRHTRHGQELLCDMRDSIASATNQSSESVQDSASLPLT